MARTINKRKLTDTQRIVIVCEGKETEKPYFEKLVSLSTTISTDDVLIYPIRADEGDGLKKDKSYYPGVFDENYDNYCYEPMRWVRAAELIISKEKCTEGWVVYDADDNFGGRSQDAHQKSYEHANKIPNLHIAFSAYCIEEWLLLHYERNSKAFHKSECTYAQVKPGGNISQKKVNCGSSSCTRGENCHGELCLGGYLREQRRFEYNVNGQLQEYDKSKGSKYAEITMGILHQACVNAAWSRSLNPHQKPYMCNPYTDVDKLVMRLLGDNRVVSWLKLDEEFPLNGESYCVRKSNGIVTLHHMSTNSAALISKSDVYWCDGSADSDYHKVADVCDTNNINLIKSQDVSLINKPQGNSILCVRNKNIEYYFEVD